MLYSHDLTQLDEALHEIPVVHLEDQLVSTVDEDTLREFVTDESHDLLDRDALDHTKRPQQVQGRLHGLALQAQLDLNLFGTHAVAGSCECG